MTRREGHIIKTRQFLPRQRQLGQLIVIHILTRTETTAMSAMLTSVTRRHTQMNLPSVTLAGQAAREGSTMFLRQRSGMLYS